MTQAAARARKRRRGNGGCADRGAAVRAATQRNRHRMAEILTVEEGQRVIAAALFSAAELTDMCLEARN